MRTIDADALVRKAKAEASGMANGELREHFAILVEWLVDKMPTVEPRAKGHWIELPGVIGVAYCSECNHQLTENNTNFCPNCGADMGGEEE